MGNFDRKIQDDTSQGAQKHERYVYLDGKFLPESQAKVSILDEAIIHAFIHGDTVQEYTRTFNGRLFKLDQHMERFVRSLRCARIQMPVDMAELKRITMEMVRLAKLSLGPNDDVWVIH